MQGMVNIVIPLGGKGSLLKIAGGIAVVFQYQMHMPGASRPSGYCRSQFCHDVWSAIVDNGVYRVEPQPIKMVFLKPVQRVMNEKITHCATTVAIKINCRSPRCLMARAKELRGISMKIIAIRPE